MENFMNYKNKVDINSKSSDIVMLKNSKISVMKKLTILTDCTREMEEMKKQLSAAKSHDIYAILTLDYHLTVATQVSAHCLGLFLDTIHQSSKGIKKKNAMLAKVAGFSDQEIQHLNDGDYNKVFMSQTVQRDVLEDLKARTDNLEALHAEVEKLFHLSKLIDQMSQQVNEYLCDLDDEVEEICREVKSGKDEVKMARSYQVRRYKCIIAAIIIIIAILAAVIIPIALKYGKKKDDDGSS
ncbi:MAG: hypothetical protein MHMPM18_004664 [Marteilia pararefringens]